MPWPWVDSVRQTGRLTVFAGPGVLRGAWAAVLPQAVAAFNRLAAQHRLGMTLAIGVQPPAASGLGGAEVAVDTAGGRYTVTYGGTTTSGYVGATDLAGATKTFRRTFSADRADQRIEKAFIFLPASPQIGIGNGRLRLAGPGVMLVIAAHELVHACGLTDADHGADDLFNGFPQAVAGQRPADDRVVVPSAGGSRSLPPLRLSAATAALIRRVWSAPAGP